MATYLGTHGSRIQNYTADPANPKDGEVWDNETSAVLKFQLQPRAGVRSTANHRKREK